MPKSGSFSRKPNRKKAGDAIETCHLRRGCLDRSRMHRRTRRTHRAEETSPRPLHLQEPRDDIWPTEVAPVIRRSGDGVELVQLEWGLDPGRPKAPPVLNFRTEGRRFANGSCLVRASHFFEFTGAKAPKAKWRFTLAGLECFCFAGLWHPSTRSGLGAFAIVTTTPGPDIAAILKRQVVRYGRKPFRRMQLE